MTAVDALISELIERGMGPAEAASLVTQAVIEGAALAAPQRSARQDRNRRYYESQKRLKASEKRLKASEKRLNKTDSDVSDDQQKEKAPTPPKEKDPPSKKNPPTGVKKKDPPSRGSRLPSDWEPAANTVAAMEAELMASENWFAAETRKFRDYWIAQPGQRGVKLDWQATWRNWMRKAAGDQVRPDGSKGARKNGHGWIIPLDGREANAWERHFKRCNDERELARFRYARKAGQVEIRVGSQWPMRE